MGQQREDTLCVRCSLAAGCMIPEESAEPVKWCDSFEDMENLLSRSDAVFWLPEPGRTDGLCVDCTNRGFCILRTREGGTWHCEEYR